MKIIAFLAIVGACTAGCPTSDNAADCAALNDFAKALDYTNWVKNQHWLVEKKGVTETVCKWEGITCAGGRVTGIKLEHNNLKGTLPDSISKLDKLEVLNLNGGRPDGYMGCGKGIHGIGNNFKNSTLPDSLFTMKSLKTMNFEYVCLGGTLSSKIGDLTNLEVQLLDQPHLLYWLH
jgi:hypothetical protein